MPPAPGQQLDPNKRADDVEMREHETRMRGHVEYPKMLHRTDGSHVIVNSRAEEENALRSGDLHPTPALAQEEKASRDEADRQRAALKVGEEVSRAAQLDAREKELAEREAAIERAAKSQKGGSKKAGDPPSQE
jgi:hypothetical protein